MNSITSLRSLSVCYDVTTCFSKMFSLEERILTLIVLSQGENKLKFSSSYGVWECDSLSGIFKSQ